jgi:hypothetical protein
MSSVRKMMRLGAACRCLWIAVACVWAANLALAQTATTSLRGEVSDPTGSPVADVGVTISETSIGFSQTHQTELSADSAGDLSDQD